jgi:hypothetical protein
VRIKATGRARTWLARLTVMKPLDVASILLVAGLVAAASILTYSGGSGFERIVITGRSGTWIYPLDSDGRIEIPGPLGKTVVAFHGGEVHIEKSPCPTQSCIQMGAINLKGQWLACLPNEVFVRIEGGADDADY